MNQIWLQIFAVMVGGSIIKYMFTSPWVWVVIDLAVLGVAYLIIRRHAYVDIGKSMLFLGGLTAISVLVDLGIIGGLVGQIIVLGVLAWLMFGSRGNNGRRRPPLRHKWHK